MIKAEGFGRYLTQLLGDIHSTVDEWHCDDMKAEPGVTTEEKEQAAKQAKEASESLIEWVVENVISERGSKAKGTKPFLVKYEEEGEPIWIDSEDLDGEQN